MEKCCGRKMDRGKKSITRARLNNNIVLKNLVPLKKSSPGASNRKRGSAQKRL
jgi:hypothetical protein